MLKPSLIPALKELERICVELEKLWCAPERLDSRVARPVITIQSGGRQGTCGWFLAKGWAQKQKVASPELDIVVPELSIAAEHLKATGPEICHTLAHELVHFFNWARSVDDTSSNDYHNKHFRRAAEDIGLICDFDVSRGWAFTRPTVELAAFFDRLAIDEDAFSIFRRSNDYQRTARTQKRVTYACCCPPCNTVQRAAGSELLARCEKCGKFFVPLL
jgi:hypothetical protein